MEKILRNPYNFLFKLLEIIYEYIKVQGRRSLYKNQLYFYITVTNNPQNEIKKAISFTIASKRIKYLIID